ncbi:T9SS type A sorting domain-containing protein [bacterium SCSIO 12741]|nr:T9SS type A sorting domain-containing protein [bacterium SCSIO 12741]
MKKVLFTLLFLGSLAQVFSKTGDTTKVTIHDQTHWDWNGNFYEKGLLPDDSKTYEKIVLRFRLGCPSQGCSGWDYTGQVFLMDTGKVRLVELARFITPYAGDRQNGWFRDWYFDITDFEPLLHDSVEINARYGGWQDGFTVTLDFLFIEGTPPRDVNSVEKLWMGSYGYGHGNNEINDKLTPISYDFKAEDKTSMLRLIPTGHGADQQSNCSEFCPKTYEVKIDGTPTWTKSVWKDDCGENGYWPQTGTWVYNRANWCPGDKVPTHDYDLRGVVTPGQTHTLDVDFESYTTSGGASYIFTGMLFNYGDFNFEKDVELLDIKAPNSYEDYGRLNPICGNPVVRIRNRGSETLESVKIIYGVTGKDLLVYEWTGKLYALEETDITLPDAGWLFNDVSKTEFVAMASCPNNGVDEYEYNNRKTTVVEHVKKANSTEVVVWGTMNNSPSENVIILSASDGSEVRRWENMGAGQSFQDNVTLTDGCYQLRITDTRCDGLSFFGNQSQGSGTLRLHNKDLTIIHPFNPNFGCSETINFSVGAGITKKPDNVAVASDSVCLSLGTDNGESHSFFSSNNEQSLVLYPNPTEGSFLINFSSPEPTPLTVRIYNLEGKVVFEKEVQEALNYGEMIDLSDQKAGMYILEANTPQEYFQKKISLIH